MLNLTEKYLVQMQVCYLCIYINILYSLQIFRVLNYSQTELLFIEIKSLKALNFFIAKNVVLSMKYLTFRCSIIRLSHFNLLLLYKTLQFYEVFKSSIIDLSPIPKLLQRTLSSQLSYFLLTLILWILYIYIISYNYIL